MKSPVTRFVMLAVAAGIGFSAAYFHAQKEQEGLKMQMGQLKIGLKEMQRKQGEASNLAQQHQAASEESLKKLDETEAQLAKANEQLNKLTLERDALKRTIAFSNKKPNKPDKADRQKDGGISVNGALKSGTLGLPPGISKGDNQLKRPGE